VSILTKKTHSSQSLHVDTSEWSSLHCTGTVQITKLLLTRQTFKTMKLIIASEALKITVAVLDETSDCLT